MFFDGPTLPVIVIGGVRQPVKEVRSDRGSGSIDYARRIAIEDRIAGEREHVDLFARAWDAFDLVCNGICRQAAGPRLVKPLFERATLIGPTVVVVACSLDGTNARQMRRMPEGREELRCSDIRGAEHANFAIRVGLSSDPLDRVVTILGFMKKGVPAAIRGVAATHILQEDDVAARCGALGKIDVITPRGAAVGSALEEDRKLAFRIRTKDVSAKGDAVAHSHGDIAFDLHGIVLGRKKMNGQE